MKAFQPLVLTLIVLVTSACASNAVKHPTVPWVPLVSEMHPASPAVAMARDQLEVTPEPLSAMPPATPIFQNAENAANFNPGAEGVAAIGAEGASEAVLDAEAIYEQSPIYDPWEQLNRKIHVFNNAVDKFVLRPLAVGYSKITPDPLQASVSRFFANLRMPTMVVNQLLQGRPAEAAQSLGRFAVNTTIGIGGVFDPASRFGMLTNDEGDFGQTLAKWGWRDSRYLVVPLFGPRTLRDAFGTVVDQMLSPIGRIQDTGSASALQLMQIVDGRTRMLPVDAVRRLALDDYLFVRDAWAQRRNHQIR